MAADSINSAAGVVNCTLRLAILLLLLFQYANVLAMWLLINTNKFYTCTMDLQA